MNTSCSSKGKEPAPVTEFEMSHTVRKDINAFIAILQLKKEKDMCSNLKNLLKRWNLTGDICPTIEGCFINCEFNTMEVLCGAAHPEGIELQPPFEHITEGNASTAKIIGFDAIRNSSSANIQMMIEDKYIAKDASFTKMIPITQYHNN
ncbi:hypothetical protein HK100_005253 [Physocladia obscura]|uniref:Uncharacterized protein n=1 Tax=Physocladia obscura TaxID=109957 RepID=A0AAD5SU10_9FUNG|nr:hypothetical protein HK100_005253 [Physocladia obscura]